MGAGAKATNITIAYVLLFTIGIVFPAHRIYLGQKWILRFLTLNFFMIGWVIDIFTLPAMAIRQDDDRTIRKAQLSQAKEVLR